MQKVAAVIITYNVGDEFIKNTTSLKEIVDEIIVIDNGSKEKTMDMLINLKDYITLISLNENKGIAYALNKGIKYALSKNYNWILTLDHDSTVSKDMLNNMLKVYDDISEEEKEKIVMITPKHIEEKQMNDIKFESNNDWNYVLTEITSGALTKASYYEKELYDEKLFIDLVDHDFCLRINSQGYKIINVNSAVLIHNLGESVKKKVLGVTITPTNHSALRRYYMTRNRKYVWNKYGQEFKSWVIKDKVRAINEIVKILIFEDDKRSKLNMIRVGLKDFKSNRWGCYFKHHK